MLQSWRFSLEASTVENTSTGQRVSAGAARLAGLVAIRHIIRVTRQVNPPCPWLPPVAEIHDFTLTRRHGGDKGPEFYQDALCYGQSQWISGKPAQAILQLDKAWMAEIPGDHPPPYQALVWILRMAAEGNRGYLGNPVRHFQHLASRMSGPRSEIRSMRAWLCFHLAERVLPGAAFPRDGRQIAREGLWIPSFEWSRNAVARHGWPAERLGVALFVAP
jgi:hypothetical protein